MGGAPPPAKKFRSGEDPIAALGARTSDTDLVIAKTIAEIPACLGTRSVVVPAPGVVLRTRLGGFAKGTEQDCGENCDRSDETKLGHFFSSYRIEGGSILSSLRGAIDFGRAKARVWPREEDGDGEELDGELLGLERLCRPFLKFQLEVTREESCRKFTSGYIANRS
jgi:hypothetical protein